MEQYTDNEIMLLKNVATEKQTNILMNINSICEVKFKGSTKKELWNFIGEWMPRMNLLKSLDADISLPIYSAKKEYNGNSIHGEWTEEHNIRNPISEEILKGHILRGNMDGVDALTEYMENSILFDGQGMKNE